ncbi:hypothetical protein HPP92_006855 [Vanilla planifolia]|uniref:Secreted protein n=1 Tax=Vanilla planifolia TaxID=51239 RepID=A0A835RQ67_VANPL|nr:hypothetical protein HPP92_007088 [Vanilla planifolia]KAG0489992.1 hypothetical protein HPP92_006855 [Vanilla planifolia]
MTARWASTMLVCFGSGVHAFDTPCVAGTCRRQRRGENQTRKIRGFARSVDAYAGKYRLRPSGATCVQMDGSGSPQFHNRVLAFRSFFIDASRRYPLSKLDWSYRGLHGRDDVCR